MYLTSQRDKFFYEQIKWLNLLISITYPVCFYPVRMNRSTLTVNHAKL